MRIETPTATAPESKTRPSPTRASLFRKFLELFGRLVFSLRYQVTLRGTEKLQQVRGPVLVLPSHPSAFDSLMTLSHLGLYLKTRPVAHRRSFTDPVIGPFMHIAESVMVPNVYQLRKRARTEIEHLTEEICDGLARGESFLIYPAGRAQRYGVEVLGGARLVSEVLTRCPNTTVILIRTTGTWGSMTSDARLGRPPENSGELLPRMLLYLFGSLVFFLPRRPVLLEIEIADFSSLPDFSRHPLNAFLERWYNTGTSSRPIFIPYHHVFGPRTFAYPVVTPIEEAPDS